MKSDLDPLQVLSGAAVALSDGDWIRAANYCDPGSLTQFKAHAERRYDPNAEEAAHVSVEVYLERTPEMPRAVAEHLVSQHRSRPSLAQQLRTEFPGFATHEQLCAAPPHEVFAAWLNGRSLRHQIERAIARHALQPEHAEAALAQASSEYAFDIIGWLPEGPEVAHVLFRERLFEVSESDEAAATEPPLAEEYQYPSSRDTSPLIATCKRQLDGPWRLIASESFLKPSSGWFGFEIEPAEEPDQSEA